MKKNLYKQAGGTLVGLIIGLIIGLGIAVGVAMVITKSSLPFTNKFAAPDKPITPSDDTPLADPNKPLYGKKPVVPDAADPGAPTTPGASVVPGAPAPTVSESTIKAPVVDKSTPPKNTASPDKSVTGETVKSTGDDDKYIYFLQAGAFRELADAESLRAKLALLGFEASVSDRQADTGTLHRVRIGPFGQLETMNRVRGKLSDNGVDVAVVRIGK
jgi:cell division protein FtsN